MNNVVFIRRDALHVDHRLLRKERVGCQPGHEVHHEVGDRPVSGMLDPGHVLQLVVDGFNQRPLAEEKLVRDGHDLPFHVILQLRNQLNPVHEKPGEVFLADVSFVPDQLAENLLYEGLVAERLPVVDVPGRDHEVQQVPLLVADQVQLEPVEPSHRTLSTPGKSLEDPVEMDALVPAYPQRGAVHEADACADSHVALLDEQDERDGDLPLQFDESVVGYGVWEQVPHMLADFVNTNK